MFWIPRWIITGIRLGSGSVRLPGVDGVTFHFFFFFTSFTINQDEIRFPTSSMYQASTMRLKIETLAVLLALRMMSSN